MAEPTRLKDTGGRVDPQDLKSYLLSKGLSENHALGILANINAESGFRPTVSGDSGTSLGLAQWHNERKDALLKYTGGSLDWQKQLDFLVQENPTKKYLATNFDTPQDASYWWTTKWERPSDAHNKAIERQKYLSGPIGATSSTVYSSESTADQSVPTRQTYVNPFDYSVAGNNPQNITKDQIERELEKEAIKRKEIAESDNLKKLEADRTLKSELTRSLTDTAFNTYVEPEKSGMTQQALQQGIAPVQFAPIQEGLAPLGQ